MAVLTSIEDVQPFLNRPTIESDLENLQKSELLLIAEFGDLEVRLSMNKQQLLQIVRKYIGYSDEVEDNVGKTEDEDILGSIKTVVSESGDSELEKLKLQFQLKQLEWAEKEKERIENEKERVEKEKEREEKRERRKENMKNEKETKNESMKEK